MSTLLEKIYCLKYQTLQKLIKVFRNIKKSPLEKNGHENQKQIADVLFENLNTKEALTNYMICFISI